MVQLEDMLQKMMRRFDASDEHAEELRCDLANIWQNVYAHEISLKHLELKMAQLYAFVNTRQPVTLPRHTIQDPKYNEHCIEITARGGKKTIDPPKSSGVEKVIRDDDTVWRLVVS